MKYKFTDISLISKDVLSLVGFYEAVFDAEAEEKDELHATLSLNNLIITIDSIGIAENTVFHYVSGDSSANLIFCFNVDDVDKAYERLLTLGVTVLNEPTTHPWGARSFQFKDPDGNILNFRSRPED